MAMNEKKVSEFLEKMADDKEFSNQLCQMDTALDVQKLAEAVDLDLSVEDILAAKDLINKMLDQHREAALSEDDLDQVAGGIMINSQANVRVTLNPPGYNGPSMPGMAPKTPILIPGLIPGKVLQW